MLAKNKIIILSLIMIMSFILIYAGLFLFSSKVNQNLEESTTEKDIKNEREKNKKPPVNYEKLSLNINGSNQEVRVLKVDPADSKVEIKPVLSQDSVFGFEKLSSLAKRSNAYAAINGGFFLKYGQPGGMTAIDGRLITKGTGRFPVLIIEDSTARLQEVDTDLKLKTSRGEIKIDNINVLPEAGQVILYSPIYGNDTRISAKNISVIIKDNIVYDIADYSGKSNIPNDGYVLSFFQPSKITAADLPLKKGDNVQFTTQPQFRGAYQAYECGSWVVRNGKIVAGDRDEWVGLLTNPDPRTAVGITEDGNVLFVTVDGRQPGYSAGVSAKELGQIMIQIGAKDAGMLDGGSSTEMIVEGKIVNKPSNRGEERLLGGALIIKLN